ncbi:hypothetical protein LCGC14_0708500 [marine sediment metagenome]|uniref:Metal-dependent hydrolase n=1 Tax=marine sediment metagenome TaxID=412755 RepID=A0A0F9QKD5_9ZZZZ|nr:MAG: hypothetical protein Lokiarch_21760 [Candidatus Lokiarchaeum sp. GC14_75]
MSRIEHHSAFGFLLYYLIYIIWTRSLIVPSYYFSAIIYFSLLPDFDAIYYFFKGKGRLKLTMEYQHHLSSLTHFPLIFFPIIIVFIISVIINFYPLYFLIPVVGIYCGHFIIDTIASGDGIMWGKNPFSRKKYTRFFNKYCDKTDGYHGRYWDARYRQTKIAKVGNYAVILVLIIIIFHVWNLYLSNNLSSRYPRSSLFSLIIFFLIFLYFGLRRPKEKWLREPPEGRYADYRVNMNYINGLSEKNRKKHMQKHQELLEKLY